LNFLILVADQLSPRALRPYGNRVVKAPHIENLAESGVVFDHAYCSSPLCAPSRASLMTGQLPSRIGVYDNGSEFAASLPTVAHRMRAAVCRGGVDSEPQFLATMGAGGCGPLTVVRGRS